MWCKHLGVVFLSARGRLDDLHLISDSHGLKIRDVAIESIASIGSARDLEDFTRERGGADVHDCTRAPHPMASQRGLLLGWIFISCRKQHKTLENLMPN
jgi:hypothetical protein